MLNATLLRPVVGLCTLLIVLAVLAVALVAGAEPATAAGPDGPIASRAAADSRLASLVEDAYGRLQAAVTADDFDVRLSGFQTIPARRFEDVLVLDVVDALAPRSLQVSRTVERRPAERDGLRMVYERVRYEPAWQATDDAALAAPDLYQGLTVAALLEKAATGLPDLRQAFALTRFDVELELAGDRVEYRAAFVWTGDPEQPRLHSLDPVVRGFQSFLAEAPPPREQRAAGLSLRSEGPQAVFGAVEDPLNSSCYAEDTTFTGSPSAQGTDNHSGGAHRSSANFQMLCRCNSDCSQTCRTSIVGYTCEDTPIALNGNHIMKSSTGTDYQTSSAGQSAPVTCSAGLGCVMKRCQLGTLFCDVSVGVSASGPSITFSSSSGYDWAGNLPFTKTCPACQVIPTEDPTDPTDPDTVPISGGGGGAEPPADDCSCDCDGDGWVTPDECVFDCGGRVNGGWCDV